MTLKSWLLVFFLAFSLANSNAQQTVFFDETPTAYRQGVDLFDKQLFGAAQKYFEKVISNLSTSVSEVKTNAQYYQAHCALELFNNDADVLLLNFIAEHPESQWVNRVYFLMGKSAYRQKDYPSVVKWMAEVDRSDLDKNELTEYQFKLGYSYFMLNQFEASGRLLYDVKNGNSPYAEPATYYFAHIAYAKGNYETALKEFVRLQKSRKFDKVVPYYVAQILYLQKKFDELLDYCLPMMEGDAFDKKADEISRLVGEAYYNTEAFEKALPYLETSVGQSSGASREDFYQLGYAYFKTGKYDKAIANFLKVASGNDLLGQTASYQLAECYLKEGNKPFAKNAFKKASNLRFDRDITEDALFNFAKLAYELSYNPYNEAIESFERYLNEYPESANRDEANEFLVSVYMTTRNYEEALSSLDRISKKDFRLQTAYQIIAFNRGVELFLNKKYESALFVFRKVQKYPFDKLIAAESLYWISECYYRSRDYEDALISYREFQRNGAAYNSEYHALADYNVGYAYFKTEKYEQALINFRKFADSKNQDLKMISDALTRAGDCYFVAKNYESAIEYYQKAITNGMVNVDYALYQKALCHGFKLEFVEKSMTLNQLLTDFPNSEYDVNARYEIGEAYFKTGKDDQALSYFTPLVAEYEGSLYMKKALLQIGLIHYRKKEYDQAINTFKRIATEFPNYQDSKDAIARAQDVYVETGKIDDYNDWVESLTFYDISKSELDSVNYRAAENVYLANDCDKSVEALKKYLTRFSPGIFGLNAHYYLAECYLKLEDEDKALENFSFVAKQPVNKFSEAALVATASLNFERKDYSESLNNYMALERVAEFKTNVLEAQIGQMRCLYNLNQFASVINLSELVLLNDNTPDEIKLEAMVSKARALGKMNETEQSIEAYGQVVEATQTEVSAEARFAIAEIYFSQTKFDSVESKVFQMIHATPSYDHWNAQAFILLADMYMVQGDAFQAKATLQSIIDYHDGEDLVEIAKNKLAEIVAKEAIKEKVEQENKEIDVPVDGSEKYNKLFDTPEESQDNITPTDSLKTNNNVEVPTNENSTDEK